MTTTHNRQTTLRARRAPSSPDRSGSQSAPAASESGYSRVRNLTESLAAPLGPEDQVIQSMPDASPTKWHRAHTTWFFEEFVLGTLSGYEPHDADFRFLFNSYYEAVGPRQPRPSRGMITRPDVNQVTAYRGAVDEAMARAFAQGRFDDECLERIELGLHHEQQHQELLLMDALHMLSQNPLAPAYRRSDVGRDGALAATAKSTTPANRIECAGGLVEVGHDPADSHPEATGFAYDNEEPRHRQWLEPFALEDRLVTSGEWLEFMADGGYERPELWLSNGWALANEENWTAPLYWSHHQGAWHQFTLHGRVEVDPDRPVDHVSYHEADAFARWRGARLPTESEWEVVAQLHWDVPERGNTPTLRPAPAGEQGADPMQFLGEAWQWTSSAYLPYPGFAPTEGAIGEYNGKFMVDQHVLRGSSSLTPPGHERLTYRNFFPPASRWAATGVRLAHDL